MGSQQQHQKLQARGSSWLQWPLVLAALVAVVLLVQPDGAGAGGPGSTPGLRHIFIGRCWEYQEVVNKAAFGSIDSKNCTELYEYFLSAFESRSPCDVNIDRYQNFTNAASHPITRDKSMFWIGVWQLVHMYSEKGRRFTTISDTLTGYLANNLVWCGSNGHGGLNTEECPVYKACDKEAAVSFWRSTSIQFAKLAQGTAYLMLNGTRGYPSFTEDSVFAQYELPNIDENNVHTIHVYIIHDLGKSLGESCNDTGPNSSIVTLKRRIRDRGFKFECTDDPISVRLLQCVDQPLHSECQSLSWPERQVSHGTQIHVFTLLPALTYLISLIMSWL